MTRARTLAAVLLAMALLGRASAGELAWLPTEPSFVARQAGYEVAPPAGWMRSLRAPKGTLVLTRDGTALQVVAILATEVGKPLGPGENRRPVMAGMSPLELSELVVDDLRASAGIPDVQLLESIPATLSGKAGFRLVASYRSSSGLALRAAIYGVVEGARFYRLLYAAPERVYFGRDLPVFDALARSFRLRVPEPPSRWEIQWRDGTEPLYLPPIPK